MTTRAPIFLALVSVQIFFGVHYIAAKYVMTEIPPLAWATLRSSGAAVLLMGYVLLTRRELLPRKPWDVASIALFSVFGVMINQICFVEGLVRTATAHSALIITSIPVATLLLAILMRRESATPRRLAGIGCSMAGVLYLIGASGFMLPSSFVTGDVLNLVNAFSFSFFLVISKPLLSRHSSLAVTAQMLVFGAVGIAAVGGNQLLSLDLRSVSAGVWGAALLIVLFPTVGAYILNAWALKRVDSSTVALFIYLQPLIASILAALLLSEPIGLESLVAGALIFTGLGIAVTRRTATGRAGFAPAAVSTDIGASAPAPRRDAGDPESSRRV